jgi:hypothetical protein
MSITTPILLLTSLLGVPTAAPTNKPTAKPTAAPTPTLSQTARLEHVMKGSTGVNGFYVKEIDGPVHAASNQARTFEPASSIKVLAHLYAMRQVERGRATLDDDVTVYRPEQCVSDRTENLREALRLMMQNSDNDRTRAVVDHFGRTKINNMVANFGLGRLEWTRAMTCEVPEQDLSIDNEMTLVQGGKLYRGVLDGTYLKSAALRRTFWELMAGQPFNATIDEELGKTMLSSTAKDAYKRRVSGASKGGWWPGKGRGSNLGWIRIPHCVDGSVEMKTFTWGYFVDDGDPDDIEGTGAVGQACNRIRKELMRDQFRASMKGWAACVKVTVADDPSAPRATKQSPWQFDAM